MSDAASEPKWVSVTTSVNAPLWVFTGIATAMVGFRVISRSCLAARGTTLVWEDYIIAFSMLVCLAASAVLSAAVTAGTRVSLADQAGTLPMPFLLSFVANTAFIISIALPKFAVAMLQLRIFEPRLLTKCLMMGGCVFVLLVAVAEYLMNWLECDPPAYQWNPFKHPDGKCWNPNVTAYASYTLGAMSAFQDFALAIYPAFQLKNLRISRRRKVYLSMLLGLGLIAGSVAIVKTWQLSHIQGNPANPAGLYNISLETGFWSAFENDIVIIAACVPTVFPFLRWTREKSASGLSSMSLTILRTLTRTGASGSPDSSRAGSAPSLDVSTGQKATAHSETKVSHVKTSEASGV